jgi:hypothetical protein
MSAAVIDRTERALADPTANLELVSAQAEDLQSTRHLFLAANLLDPARQRDIGMGDGGEELANVCLRRTQGRLPKCEVTPLEFWVEWMPKELIPEGLEHMALALKDTSGEVLNPDNRIFKPLFGFPYYPGNTVVDAIGLVNGERRGIVEIESLRGVEYGKEDRELQTLFFPADYKKPIELRLVEQHIIEVATGVADPDAKDAANYMLESVAQSREYMGTVISIAQSQLAERKTHHFVHRLTPKTRSFMAQLEITPPVAAQMQETVDRAVSSSLPPEVLEQLAQNSAAMATLPATLSQAIGDAVREAVAAAITASKTPAKTKPSE